MSLVNDDFPSEHLFSLCIKPLWYVYLANYLTTGKLPQHLSSREKQRIVKSSTNYSWIEGDLFCTRPDLIIRRSEREDEVFKILKACHDEPCGGYFDNRSTAYKVFNSGYYWPTLFKDAKTYVKSCDNC